MLLFIFLLAQVGFGFGFADNIPPNHQCLFTCGCMKYYGDTIDKRLESIESGSIVKSRTTKHPNSSHVASESTETGILELKEMIRTNFDNFENSIGGHSSHVNDSIKYYLQDTSSEVGKQTSLINEMLHLLRNEFKGIGTNFEEIKKKQEGLDVFARDKLKRFDALTNAVNIKLKPVFLKSGRIVAFRDDLLETDFSSVKLVCENAGMKMITVHNQSELDELQDAAENFNPSIHVWLSASNMDDGEGNFKWADGTKLDTKSKLWLTKELGADVNQPDDYKNGKNACVYFDTKNTYNRKLLDAPCRNFGVVACEL
ncbi:Hypothetical predicted protein [Cloeon dipterum]|uniref:C-type lectin domain-containing protein n=2 Tax=Cloeon dipterum TaxID=197152 RepID=A0A8S1CSL5_9INSE|nr:Hypothetical predicted protein [Cloeon dipterum]